VRKALLAILLLATAAIVAWSKYSTVRADLAAQREAIGAEWSLVDEAMQRRAELVPALVPAAARSGAGAAPWKQLEAAASTVSSDAAPPAKIEANTRISALLGQFPLRESGAARQRLSDAENRIAVARRRYNEMLEHYNAQIQRFPDNMVARVAGFRRDDAYLPTEAGAQN
jgi:LemA protein